MHSVLSNKICVRLLKCVYLWSESKSNRLCIQEVTSGTIAIIEHDLQLGRPVAQVLRILGSSLLDKVDLPELFGRGTDDGTDDSQVEIEF